MRFVEVYTDGGCRPNPGEGAYAFVILENNKVIYEKAYYEKEATNNIMEVTAILKAIRYVRSNLKSAGIAPDIYITTDSQYASNGINSWGKGWKAKNFQGVANAELWKSLFKEIDMYPRKINVQWVRGHNGNKYNHRADKLCTDLLTTKREPAKPQLDYDPHL